MEPEAFSSMARNSDSEELFNALFNFIVKLMSSNDKMLDAIDKGWETATCIFNSETPTPPSEVKTKDIIKLLSDPDVKRGIYVLLGILKVIGSCSQRRIELA